MKKVFIGIATVLVVSAGGLLVAGQINDEPNNEVLSKPNESNVDNNKTESNVDIKEDEESFEIPTQRTNTIMGMPWENYDNKTIDKKQSEGEIVYLYSDADEVENRMVEVSRVDPDAEGFNSVPYTKDEMAAGTSNIIKQFTEDVQPYVDNEAYFDKLEEVRQALINAEYDSVPSLIEEAKKLRESE